MRVIQKSNRKMRRVNKRKQNNNQYIVLNEAGRFAPDRIRVKLIFQDPSAYRTATGSSQAMNWGFRSSAYDPDPLVLSGSIPGFAELANLYSQYCVHAMDVDLKIGNQNTESIIVVVWPSNVLANQNSLTLGDIQEYSGNPRAKSVLIGSATGNSIGNIRTSAKGSSLVGERFRTDLDYSASTSTNPVAMFYLNIGVIDPVANFTYGVVAQTRIIYDVEFFKIRQLES